MAAEGERLEGAATGSASSEESVHWRRNLYVCLFGSFTTIASMTLLLPFLPIYVEQLGVSGHAAIVQWSGIAYSATFLFAALLAPVWGRLADRYGRKPMMIRASLGMAITMSLMGTAHNIYELVGLRLLAGLVGGYASGSVVLVATQTPKAKSGWAIGVISSGIMAGNLVGPLIGGALPPLIGLRDTFFLSGGVIFLTFLSTCFFIKEEKRTAEQKNEQALLGGPWSRIEDRRPVYAMLITAMLMMLANMSIEPIITVYVAQFVSEVGHVTMISGIVMSAAAFGSVLSASHLGKLADRIGALNVVIGCLTVSAILLVPQAFVTASWQLILLRFFMGVTLGGLIPSVTSVIRHSVPHAVAGNILGYSTSAQYAGQVIGPLVGGFVGGHFGLRTVFLATSGLMAIGALFNWRLRRRQDHQPKPR
jgi:MFS family permease